MMSTGSAKTLPPSMGLPRLHRLRRPQAILCLLSPNGLQFQMGTGSKMSGANSPSGHSIKMASTTPWTTTASTGHGLSSWRRLHGGVPRRSSRRRSMTPSLPMTRRFAPSWNLVSCCATRAPAEDTTKVASLLEKAKAKAWEKGSPSHLHRLDRRSSRTSRVMCLHLLASLATLDALYAEASLMTSAPALSAVEKENLRPPRVESTW